MRLTVLRNVDIPSLCPPTPAASQEDCQQPGRKLTFLWRISRSFSLEVMCTEVITMMISHSCREPHFEVKINHIFVLLFTICSGSVFTDFSITLDGKR